MATPRRVRLQSLGCRLNEAELEGWAEGFRRLGLAIAADGEPADLVIVNTCAVTQEAARKSGQMLRRGRRLDPQAQLVVSGCLATLEPDTFTGASAVDLLVPNPDKDRLVEIAAAALDLRGTRDPDIDQPSEALFSRGRQRAFLKVQDGCRHRCTFCVTTLARGAERSRPIAEVVAQVNRLAASGIREIVLTGVHLGGYGSDLGPALDLADLIHALLVATAVPRIRIGSLEPWNLPDRFWDLFSDPRLMPHLHLPMQSGSAAVLRRMGRRCATAELARLAAEGRAAVPGLNLTTDIIAGFPGETETDWQQTLEFVEAMGFGHVHVFPYSSRPGTHAASLPARIDAATRQRRVQALAGLAQRLRRRVLEGQIGTCTRILVEEAPRSTRPGVHFGYTPNYLPVQVEPDTEVQTVGGILEVRVLGLTPDGESLWAQRESASA